MGDCSPFYCQQDLGHWGHTSHQTLGHRVAKTRRPSAGPETGRRGGTDRKPAGDVGAGERAGGTGTGPGDSWGSSPRCPSRLESTGAVAG